MLRANVLESTSERIPKLNNSSDILVRWYKGLVLTADAAAYLFYCLPQGQSTGSAHGSSS